MDNLLTQQAPYPIVLKELVENMTYKPGWEFNLVELDRGQGSKGLTLDIISLTHDSHHPDRGIKYRVHHYMIVPAASFNRQSWQRWIFEQLLLIEQHEACEFYRISGEQPYAPNHGPGNDPYIVRELTTDEDRRTSFRGVIK